MVRTPQFGRLAPAVSVQLRSSGHVALWSGGALLAWIGFEAVDGAIARLIPDVGSYRYVFWQMSLLTVIGVFIVVMGIADADRSLFPLGIILVIVGHLRISDLETSETLNEGRACVAGTEQSRC